MTLRQRFPLTFAPSLLSGHFSGWALRRHDIGEQTQLSHRNIYILPTLAGWLFGAVLAVLLLAAINYQLNLGYLLTFLLAGSFLSSLHVTHNNLRGLHLTAHMPESAQLYVGQPAALRIRLQSTRRVRWGIRLAASRQGWHALDVKPDSTLHFALPWIPPVRGHQMWPVLVIETRYPLGLWRAWSVWQPTTLLWIYPAPESPAPGLPPQQEIISDGSIATPLETGDELDELRSYRRGDSMRHVLWKKASTEDLVVRVARFATVQQEWWLRWSDLPATLSAEARLSRLCAWVLCASHGSEPFGLHLPHCVVPLGRGPAHTRRCLRELAQFGHADVLG